MAFNNIIGQKKVKDILYTAIKEDRLSHAYALCAPEGMGKRTLARKFAKLLLCIDKQDMGTGEGNALGECNNCNCCHTFESGANPDFHYIETMENTIKIDAIRKMQEEIAIRPMYADKKVYVICDAHKMTQQAQNCLLKTLEEPPNYVVIILTVSMFENLLETIRSRVFRIDFTKNTQDEVKQAILNKMGSVPNFEFIASYADGNIGTALKCLENSDFIKMRERVTDYLLSLGDIHSRKNFSGVEIFEEYKENIDEILDICTIFLRDILVIKTNSKQNILINSDKKDIIKRDFNNFSIDRVMKSIEVIEDVRRGLNQNANFSLAIEYLTLQLQEE